MMQPFVTVIVPTTHDRKDFNEKILNNYIRQDYHDKHILFDYGEETIGYKRNRLCQKAPGQIIVHMDSDDKYADDWISKSVLALLENQADVTGLKELDFFEPIAAQGWKYTYANDSRPWVAGATMVYWKSFWEKCEFMNINQNEDGMFLSGRCGVKPRIFAHDYVEGFLASIHEGNTSKRQVDNVRYRRMSEQEEEDIKERFFRVRSK